MLRDKDNFQYSLLYSVFPSKTGTPKLLQPHHIQRDSLRKVAPLQYSHVQRYLRQALQQLTILMPISQILSLRILITYIYIRIFDVPAKNHEPGPLGIQSTSKPSIHLAVPTIYSKIRSNKIYDGNNKSNQRCQ